MVNSGRLELPPSADVPTFLTSDGKLANRPSVQERRLGRSFDQYFDQLPPGSLDPDTVKMMQGHRRRLEERLGKNFSLRTLCFNDLQAYINRRAQDRGRRGKPLKASTIQKELVTLRGLWKWAAASGEIPNRDFPSVGLRYPITDELPPFQTFEEVVSQIQYLAEDSCEFQELWATVFLNRDEVEELLDYVQATATQPFVYPAFAFAAHTGARRSEIMRSRIIDIAKLAYIPTVKVLARHSVCKVH